MADLFLAALDQATRTVVARVLGEVPAAALTTTAEPCNTISHTYCCDPNRALCGMDLSGTPTAGTVDQDCVVCTDLDEGDAACPLCTSDKSGA